MTDFVHTPAFIEKDEADVIFAELLGLDWRQQKWSRGFLPRLVFSYNPLIDKKTQILDDLMARMRLYGIAVESVWCNYYRSGADYTPPHQDSYGTDVYTLSFGAPRKCVFAPLDPKGEKKSVVLSHGDLLYFSQETNSKYRHSIPKTTKPGERISVVFFG